MNKNRWPQESWTFLGFLLLTAAVSAGLIFARGWGAALVFLMVPILVSAFHYRRLLFHSMTLVLAIFSFIVSLLISQHVTSSIQTILGLGITTIVLTEIIYHLSREWQKANEQVSRSERRFHTIFTDSPTGIAIFDQDGHLGDMNPACSEILGNVESQYNLLDDPRFTEDTRQKLIHKQPVHFQTQVNAARPKPHSAGGSTPAEMMDVDIVVTPMIFGQAENLGGYLLQIQDITGLRSAERALQESRDQINNILSSIDDAVWSYDLNTRQVLYISPAIEKILNRPIQGYLLKPALAMKIIHPEDLDRVKQEFQQLFNGAPADYNFRVLTPDGSIRHLHERSWLVKNENGLPLRVDGIFSDVTQAHNIELALRESETKYRSFVEQSLESFMLVDEQGDLIEWNDASEKLTGLPRNQALGRKVWDVLFELLPVEQHTSNNLELLKGSFLDAYYSGSSSPLQRTISERIQRTNGEFRNIQRATFPIQSGKQLRQGIIIRDVTEQTKVEEALQNTEARYRQMVEQVSVVLYINSNNLLPECLYMSPKIETLTGYPVQEWTNDPTFWDRIIAPDDRDLMSAEMKRTRQTGDPFRLEYRLIKKNGSTAWIHDEAALIHTDLGEPLYWQGVLYDITDRKQYEARLRDSQMNLEKSNHQLSHILSLGNLLKANLSFDSLLKDVVQATSHSLEYQSVVLNLINRKTGLLQVAAYTGLDEAGEKLLHDSVIPWEDVPKIMQDRFAISGCYFIPEGAFDWDNEINSPSYTRIENDQKSFQEDDWHPDDFLLVPIHSDQGQVIGFISVDRPQNGKRPTVEIIQALAIFGNQAEVAIRNAWLFEDLQTELVQREKTQGDLKQRVEFEQLIAGLSAHFINMPVDQFDNGLVEALYAVARHIDSPICSLFLFARNSVKVTQTHEWCENPAESITKCLEKVSPERFTNFCQELLQNRDVVVRRLYDLPQDSVEVKHYLEFGFRSMICVPLLSDGAVYGAMVAFGRREEERNWSEEDVSLLRVVSGILSNAMERKRAEEAEREQRRLAEALRDTANALNSTLDIDEVLDNILVNVGRVVPHDSSNIMILEGDYVKIARSWGYETPEKLDYVRHFYCSVNDLATLQKMSESLQPILVSDAEHDASWVQSRESNWIKSYAGVPVCIQEHLIGFINLNSSQPGFFQVEHLERLQAFANQAAIAIQNSQLYIQVQTMSITDSLTGLYNRRGLFNLGEREVDRSRRFNRPLSALFIDIDHFKRVNDAFSHSVGDEVLCAVAERFRSVVRSVDIIGRYGGEEFVILLPEVELDGARQVGERLRQVIAGTPVHLSTGDISITISVGVAQFSPAMQELSVLLHLTDEAMYSAKQAGRNLVMAAD